MKTFDLTILTPYGKYLSTKAEYIQVTSEDYTLGILPGHTPLISTLVISTMVVKLEDGKFNYAIGGGIIKVDHGKVTLILDSIERADEIDFARAEAAKTRAEQRLKNIAEGGDGDFARAKLALTRAQNRIKLK